MKKKVTIEHRIVLYLTKECDTRTMSPQQIKKWIEDRFKGSDYGSLRVALVDTDEIGEDGKKDLAIGKNFPNQ